MVRVKMLIRVSQLLGVIAVAAAAPEFAAAQVACVSGYLYNPLYGCLMAGEAYPQPVYPLPGVGHAPHLHPWGNVPHPGEPAYGTHIVPFVGGGHGHR